MVLAFFFKIMAAYSMRQGSLPETLNPRVQFFSHLGKQPVVYLKSEKKGYRLEQHAGDSGIPKRQQNWFMSSHVREPFDST